MIKTTYRSHNGVDYQMIGSNQLIEGSLGFGESKYILKGRPSIVIMDHSYKYGNQVQINVFNKAGTVRQATRVPYAGLFDRIEMFFNKEEFIEMCKTFLNSQGELK
jgi:hypothetical protein